jgi:hypothetical protein
MRDAKFHIASASYVPPIASQICRRIATAMGGELTAASEGRGMGTTLTFIVPLSVPPPGDGAAADDDAPSALPAVVEAPLDASSRAAEAAEVIAPPPITTARPASPPPLPPLPPASTASSSSSSADNILVAEDDPLSQVVMRKVLQRLQLRFTIVGNGAAAVEAYKQDVFTLVLMDLHSASPPRIRGCYAAAATPLPRDARGRRLSDVRFLRLSSLLLRC